MDKSFQTIENKSSEYNGYNNQVKNNAKGIKANHNLHSEMQLLTNSGRTAKKNGNYSSVDRLPGLKIRSQMYSRQSS